MAEIGSDVFDILNPTPVPLRELSAIVISLEIWRCEINKYRSSNTLKEFRPTSELISLKTILVPDLPSVIYPMIDKYVKIFGDSMKRWLGRHYVRIFKFQYDHNTCVLEYFEDFVCDYDGSIHYGRTAKRMMLCDRFEPDQKFLIACTYCFEDDTRQFYPLISFESILPNSSIEKLLLIYWKMFLENHIQASLGIVKLLFDCCMPVDGRSLEYFWNRVPPEQRLQKSIDLFTRDLRSFVRHILPKLNRQQLDEFLNEKGCELIYDLLTNSNYDEEFVLRTWAYVKNATNEVIFTNLVVKILQCEFMGFCISYPLCFEIWNSAPESLKRSTVEAIASNEKIYQDSPIMMRLPPLWREFKFMLAILSYATYEQRNAFWHNGWHRLIYKIRGEDLHAIMKLCFQNEDEITRFKENVMANHNEVLDLCGFLLQEMYLNDLNDFVNFLLPEIQTARNFKQQLLQFTFLDDGPSDFSKMFIQKSEEFDEFICGAYNDVDESKNFKNQLVSSFSIQNQILDIALFVPTEQLIKFTDLFVSNEEILLQLKTRMIDFLKETARDTKSRPPFISVLSWCLGSDEEVAKFKLKYLSDP
ncbi:uncharacterized protein LOC135848801 isoform X1 [Planococcus citri]|uniref:uncharacterized protein LOC135848801 isoform X1 n=1 Tax=Planococcus citri TaxID=170843 RepID=UPI0031F9BDCF